MVGVVEKQAEAAAGKVERQAAAWRELEAKRTALTLTLALTLNPNPNPNPNPRLEQLLAGSRKHEADAAEL